MVVIPLTIAQLAKELHAKIRFLKVVDTFYPTLDGFETINFTEVVEALRERGKHILEQATATAGSQGIETDTVMLETYSSRVSDIIIAQAKEWPADLIIMGTHGRRGLNHLLMGSDAEAVIRTSPIPVLTVRLAEKK
jgi:nucleotide-binding universal stress UspA family protein